MKTRANTTVDRPPSIHPATRPGHVALTVADLDSQVAFYRQALGFSLHWYAGGQAGLGAGGPDLLRLVQQPDARRYRQVTGLYHFAVLFPDQRGLARALARLSALGIPNAPTDHIMTKSTYLDDPEGNGIELYAESPEDGTWTMTGGQFLARRADGSLSDGREPLDVEALFALLGDDPRPDAPIPEQTRLGHVHLHVRDLDEAVGFYHGLLGFDLMGIAQSFRMAFVSAGGYHHHVGLNTWAGEGAPQPPAGALGLRHFTVELPGEAELERLTMQLHQAGIVTEQSKTGLLLRDPSGNGIMLTASKS